MTVTPDDQKKLLARFNCNGPAQSSAIARLKANPGLPDDYLEFLQQIDGGEGFVGSAYIVLWRSDELQELNAAYQVADYAPGLFLFGSDGGGEAFAFDLRSDAKPIVSVPFVGMDVTTIRPVASNLAEFYETLFDS